MSCVRSLTSAGSPIFFWNKSFSDCFSAPSPDWPAVFCCIVTNFLFRDFTVFSIGIALLAYSLPVLFGGSGYLAVYICGIFIGNSPFLYRRNFLRFNDSLNWIMQIAMFLILGLLAKPAHFAALLSTAAATSAFLILLARPLAVFVCLYGSSFSFSQQILIAWAGLKGAVPIILATYPLMQNLPQAQYIFNLVFFLVLISVLVQGTALPLLARSLTPQKGPKNE